jgi:hypothetical protein
MKLSILPLLVSLALMAGCASDFESTDSTSSASIDTSSVDSFNETQRRINNQMAVDAANAAANQQFNDAMAAAQQTMNNANAEFNQNGLH